MIPRQNAIVTKALVGINVAVYLFMMMTNRFSDAESNGQFFQEWGLVPSLFLAGSWWQPLTCLFIHGGPMHLLMNMIGLWSLGTPIENTIGSTRFTWLYFISGASSSLFVIAGYLFNPDTVSGGATVGASGAVLGILGALALFYPNSMLLVFFIPMRAITAVIAFAVISVLLQIFGGLSFISHLGHLGGLVAGVLYSKFALGHSFGKHTLSGGRNPFSRGPQRRPTPQDDIVDLLNSLTQGPKAHRDEREEKVINPYPEDLSSHRTETPAPESEVPPIGKKLYFDPATGKFYFK